MEITPIPLQNDINTEGGQYHALFIGIDKYKNKNNFPSLGCAVNDAYALMEVLTKKYTFSGQIKLLENETADFFSIDRELRALRNHLKIKKEDSILIFFAGHGQYDENDREGYIIPFDGKSNFENCFSYGNIVKKYLSNIECKNIALILDCCNAGEIFNEPIKKDEIRCDSIFLFAASRKDEYAHEGIENSPFTENIVKIFNSNIEEKILVTVLSSRIEDIFLNDKYKKRYPQSPIGSYLNPSRKGDGFIFFSQNTEESAWEKAIHEHTFEAYNTFKLNYPESQYPVEDKIALIEEQTLNWQKFIEASLLKIEIFISDYKEGQKNYIIDAEKLKLQFDLIYENLNKKRIIQQDLRKLTSRSSIEDWEQLREKHSEHPEFQEYNIEINSKINHLKNKSQAEKDWIERKAKISREQKPKIVRDLCTSYLEEHVSYVSSEIYKYVDILIEDSKAFINAQESENYESYLENWKNKGHFVKEASAKRQEQVEFDKHKKFEKQRQEERMMLDEITFQKDYLKLTNFTQNEPLIKEDALKYLNQWEAYVKQEIEKINKNSPIYQLENFIEDYQDYPHTKEVRNWIEERDIETYDLARTSRDIISLKLYLDTFTNGEYRGLAKDLIEEIEQEEIENLKNIDEKTINTVFEREAQDLTENQDLELVESKLEDNYIPTIIEDNQNEVENTTSKTVVDDSDLNYPEILNLQTDIEIKSEVIKTLDDSELVDDSNSNNEMDTSLVNDYEEQGLGIDKKDDVNHGISTNENILVSEKIKENSIGLAFLFILYFVLFLIVILYYFLIPIL